MNTFDDLGTVLISDMEAGDPEIRVDNNNATFFLQKTRRGEKKSAKFESDQGAVIIPPMEDFVDNDVKTFEYQVCLYYNQIIITYINYKTLYGSRSFEKL